MALPGAAPPGRAATSLIALQSSWGMKHRLVIATAAKVSSLLRPRQQRAKQDLIALGFQEKNVQRPHAGLSRGAIRSRPNREHNERRSDIEFRLKPLGRGRHTMDAAQCWR